MIVSRKENNIQIILSFVLLNTRFSAIKCVYRDIWKQHSSSTLFVGYLAKSNIFIRIALFTKPIPHQNFVTIKNNVIEINVTLFIFTSISNIFKIHIMDKCYVSI